MTEFIYKFIAQSNDYLIPNIHKTIKGGTTPDDSNPNLQLKQPILYYKVSILSSNQISSWKNISKLSNVSYLNLISIQIQLQITLLFQIQKIQPQI